MTLKLGDMVRAPGRVSRCRVSRDRREWRRARFWAVPIEGMFVGVRNYQNGVLNYGTAWDDPTWFKQDGTVKVALLAIDPRHNPTPVLYDECEVIK